MRSVVRSCSEVRLLGNADVFVGEHIMRKRGLPKGCSRSSQSVISREISWNDEAEILQDVRQEVALFFGAFAPGLVSRYEIEPGRLASILSALGTEVSHTSRLATTKHHI